jgi:cytochrome c oxidase subunit 2
MLITPTGVRSVLAATVLVLSSLLIRPVVSADGVREFRVTAKKYEFVPARLEVAEGDTVRIVIHSADSTHGIGIKALDVKTEVPKNGEPVTLEFVADQAGEFVITCTKWCGKGHKSMKGTLIVRPRTTSASPQPRLKGGDFPSMSSASSAD